MHRKRLFQAENTASLKFSIKQKENKLCEIKMATSFPYSIHSAADAVASIDQGEDPWFALGCFLHDWWRYAVDRRQDLINTPPAPTTTADGKHWAAFLPQP
jgi:hypothetical protein